jgi:hypothetical protein
MLFGRVLAVPLVVLAVSIVEGYQLDEIGEIGPLSWL